MARSEPMYRQSSQGWPQKAKLTDATYSVNDLAGGRSQFLLSPELESLGSAVTSTFPPLHLQQLCYGDSYHGLSWSVSELRATPDMVCFVYPSEQA